ncbi:MAG TPA: hypothetical protein VH599_22270 [Ktedonobacterales bacterium]|jgi:hypothetical protein
MRQFSSIAKLDAFILYTLELASSLSVILLAFGLIASMANVLTKGSVLTDNEIMRQIWAWSQCAAIDASVPGTIMRSFHYWCQHEWAKATLYTLLSALLLFTAAIVSNIEAVQQTLNITLDSAYLHVFVSVEALIWIRSIAIVLIIVAHALRHVGQESVQQIKIVNPKHLQSTLTIAQAVPTKPAQRIPKEPTPIHHNFNRVKEYLADHPKASAREVGRALGMSATTAAKWVNKVRAA